MKSIFKELRVHHYIKNLLVFAALVCSGDLFHISLFKSSFFGFLAFSMMSSVIYIINDIKDKEKDRNHPTKCKRPIASGELSVKTGVIMSFVLFALSFTFNAIAFSIYSFIALLVYFLLNLGYSLGLKNIPLVDITILVTGFFIRVWYGAFICGIEISNWLYLTVIALSFAFALGKRRNELKRQGENDTRKVLRYYTESFLDKSLYICLGLAVTFYALWASDKGQGMIWTFPLVLLISMEYIMNIEGDSDGDPVEVLLHDKILMILSAIFIVAFIILV